MINLFYYIRRFWEMPEVERKLLIKGVVLFLTIKITLYFIPFKYHLLLFKQQQKNSITEIEKKLGLFQAQLTLRRISRLLPIEFSCLLKSIVFKLLLKSLGIKSIIVFGVIKNQNMFLKTHAFLRIDEGEVYFFKKDYKEISMTI